MYRLEKAVAKRLGIEVKTIEDADGGRSFHGDAEAAYLVLALSPHTEATDTTGQLDCPHPGYHATEAATWDVIAVARARGMYVPGPTEYEDPALEVRS
jgi:hypothetical protein